MEDKVLNNYKNPVEDFISKKSQEIADSFPGDENFKENIGEALKSIINESEVKTSNEEINDINNVINNQVEAKKIHLTTSDFVANNPESVEKYRKEEFKRSFEEEIKKTNPNITEDQLSKSREYADLVAENYFEHNELSAQKNVALSENSEIFGPGAMQNGWTDLQGTFNFLKKKPQEIKEIKDKYNSLKGDLKDIKLPTNLRQVGSLENVMSAINDPNNNDLFSRTKKYMGWADKIDKLTGGWLKKTVGKAGEKVVSKIGNQFIKEFATNSLNVLAKEGFQKGFTTVLNGILKGGVEKVATKVGGQVAVNVGQKVAVNTSQKVAMKVAAKIATKVAVKAGAQSALLATATAFAAIPGVGWIVTAALLLIDAALWLKKKFGKLAEKLGISTKRFFEENFGKVGGWLIRTSLKIIALPLMLVGAVSAVALLPIMIGVFGFMFIFQIFQGGLISGLVPPKGQIIKNVVVSVVKNKINSATGKIVGVGCPSGWPASGGISQGSYTKKRSGENDNPSHWNANAVDIARRTSIDPNPKVYATHEGRVIWVSSSGSCGNGLNIEGSNCDGVTLFRTQYCHMVSGSLAVGLGQKVKAGTFLGMMGTTGNSTGVHLHYSLKGLPLIENFVPTVDKYPLNGYRSSNHGGYEIPVNSSYE